MYSGVTGKQYPTCQTETENDAKTYPGNTLPEESFMDFVKSVNK